MNEIMKNPVLMIGAAVVILLAVTLAGKNGGSTYSVQTGATGADIKARADAQAVTDKNLTDARQGLLTGILGYDKQRSEFQTATLKIRTDAVTSRLQTASAERLGMAGIASAERLGLDSNNVQREGIQAGERMNQDNNNVQRDGQTWGFFGTLFGGIFKLIGLAL